MIILEVDNLEVFYYLKSCLIRKVTFDGSGLSRFIHAYHFSLLSKHKFPLLEHLDWAIQNNDNDIWLSLTTVYTFRLWSSLQCVHLDCGQACWSLKTVLDSGQECFMLWCYVVFNLFFISSVKKLKLSIIVIYSSVRRLCFYSNHLIRNVTLSNLFSGLLLTSTLGFFICTFMMMIK